MKKRYYLSMLSVFLLITLFDTVYFFMHQSIMIWLYSALAHVVLYILLNFPGIYFLYKPIDILFAKDEDTELAKKRITRLSWYSGVWIFSIGLLYVTIQFSLLFLFPNYVEQYSFDRIPLILLLDYIPSLLFVYAIFPAFIMYFLINDFVLDLKTDVFSRFKIVYPAGRKRIGQTLFMVFIILVFFPTLLAILDIATFSSVGIEQFSEFMTTNPLTTVIIDRFVILVGMVFAIVLITRSFTKPIHSLLQEIDKVRAGDYSIQAAVIMEDEIGVLTQEFNDMVQNLQVSHTELEEYSRTLEEKVKERTRELEENQLKLLQSEKMAALGNLVAGVSHEINNPMGAIVSTNKGTSKILERLLNLMAEKKSVEEFRDDQKFQEYVSLLQENNKLSAMAGERITKIVKTLKNFARLDEAEFQLADIHEGIEDTLLLLHHELKNRVEVKTEFGDLPKLYCNPNQLNQVFMNITMNAVQSIDGKGEISIRTYSDETRIYVEITDNGRGIPAENLERIFDPGFTTKSSGVGTGLGLSIVYKIIEAHKGDIRIESAVGEGSKFIVELPITQS